MCFSNKDEKDDAPAPRPASQQQQQQQQATTSASLRPSQSSSRRSRKSEKKRSSSDGQHQQQNGESSGVSGSEYAPPPGPPPGHQQPQQQPTPPTSPPAQSPGDEGDYAPPPGPPPGWTGQQQQQQQYDAPLGPPPGHHQESYDAPSGPPPGQFDAPAGPPPGHQQSYDAPSGPPPGHQQDSYDAPSGPPPGHEQQLYGTPSSPPPGQFDAPAGPPPGHQQESYDAPSGPPPGHEQQLYGAPSSPPPGQFDAPSGPPPGTRSQGDGDFAPPPGPPPGPAPTGDHFAPPSSPPAAGDFAPPTGPPPGGDQYAPPPGPPPAAGGSDYAPPPGPPPAKDEAASKHNWEQVVPDTSLFPPPPAYFTGHDRSPANNASEQEAEAGAQWCEQYPLIPAAPLPAPALKAIQSHDIVLMQPQGFRGTLDQSAIGIWEGRTDANAHDSCIIGFPPLYSAMAHSPLATGRPFKIYYEVHIRPDSKADEVDLALGFTALPYPNFRMPGWHRGSLAVHGDDGHKYINDIAGGKDFTEPFVPGETYGIGMAFSLREDGTINTDVFFTREGRLAGSWNLHEESDSREDLPVTGLEGFNDLSCAIGTFDHNSFEVIFDPSRFKYKELEA